MRGVANAPHLRILNSDCIGTGFLHQLEGSFLTLRRRSCKCSAFADFETRLRRGRKETLRVSGFYVPTRDGRPGGHQLMAAQASLRELGFPPCGGFELLATRLADEHKRRAHLRIESSIVHPNPRADYVASAETCDEFRLHRNSSVCNAESWPSANFTRRKQRSKRALKREERKV